MKSKYSLSLLTDTCVPSRQGSRSLQDSVVNCTRCNSCAQSCPAYLHNPQEPFSPRGRAQLIRLLSEHKLRIDVSSSLLEEITRSCTWCARCTAACAGSIPVPHYMLALSKVMSLHRLPFTLRVLLRLYSLYPRLFDKLISAMLCLRRIGLLYILRPILPAWLRHADSILPRKIRPLSKLLKQQNYVYPDQPKGIYLPTLYASYAQPQTGLSLLQLLPAGKTAVLLHCSSGLTEYLYGKEVYAQQAAKHLLLLWEKLSARHTLPLFTDSIEVYAFLRNYPLLFTKWPGWQKRAQKMAQHVKFITDISLPKLNTVSDRPTALDTSSILYPAGEVAERARKILLTKCKKNLLECEYSDISLPAGGIGFMQGVPTEANLRQYVQDIARRQIADVYCLSGWAALELRAACKRLYPQASVEHFVQVTEYGRAEKGKHATVR